MYESIKQHRYIVLATGSGLSGSEDVWPRRSGEWSMQFGAQPMPFDGVVFTSWVTITKEAHTNRNMKDLIVTATGVDDPNWGRTYPKETGGILAV